jgi:hypothetical protein
LFSFHAGDFVWIDNNFNGIQNVGEPGVAGVSVTLFFANGSQIATTVTNSTGMR